MALIAIDHSCAESFRCLLKSHHMNVVRPLNPSTGPVSTAPEVCIGQQKALAQVLNKWPTLATAHSCAESFRCLLKNPHVNVVPRQALQRDQ